MKKILAALLSLVLAVGQTKVDYPTQVKNGPVVVDTAYTTLLEGCNVAATYHASFNVTKQWLNVPTTSCNAVVNYVGNAASIQPANGAVFTMNGYTALNRRMVWDVSLGGLVRLSAGVAGTPVYAGNFSSLAGACDTATAAGIPGGSPLILDSPVTVSTSTACAANITASAGGVLSPGSAVVVTLSGSFIGDLSQHFDSSAGSFVIIGTVAYFYPEWAGAKCSASDNTTAIQNILNMVPSGYKLQFSCLYKVQAGSLYVPSTMHNAIIEGAPGTWAFLDRGLTNMVGLQAITGHSGTLLTVLAPGVHVQNLWLNCAGFASHGIVVQNATLGLVSNVGAGNCTSDGAQSNPYAGPTTILTSNIGMGAGPSTTFTVQSAVLPGQTLGAPDCTEVMVHYGNSDQDAFVVSSSGNTLTITSGTSVNAHAMGQSIQCMGSNGSLLVYGYQAYRNAGWGWNMFQATNENGIVFQDPTMFVNGLGGLLGTGSVNIHRGGHYEANGGPALQLGDLNGDSFFGPGRPTVGWTIGQFGDDEGNSPNGITSICDFHSSVQVADITQFHTNNPGGPFCPFDPGGVSTIVIGRASETGTGSPQFAAASGLGDSTQTPGTDHSFQAHDLSGTLLRQKTYTSTGSFSTLTGPKDINTVTDTGTGTPANQLVVTLNDPVTSAPVVPVEGLPLNIHIAVGNPLVAGLGNKILYNGVLFSIGNQCGPNNFKLSRNYFGDSIITLTFNNSYGIFIAAGSCQLVGTTGSLGPVTDACASRTDTLAGSLTTDAAVASPTTNLLSGGATSVSVVAWVSATDTITTIVCGAGTVPASTYNIRVE